MKKYRIDWHFIDDDGYIVTQHMEEFDSLEDATKMYSRYIRLTCYGWYDLVVIEEI